MGEKRILVVDDEPSILSLYSQVFSRAGYTSLFVLDEQGNMINVNETVIQRLEYSEDDLIGRNVLMVHPEDRQSEAGRIVGEMIAGTADFCPVPLVTKSGKHIQVETRVYPSSWNGKPALFGAAKDITAQICAMALRIW